MSDREYEELRKKLVENTGLGYSSAADRLMYSDALLPARAKPDGILVTLREATSGPSARRIEIRVLAIPDIGQVIIAPNSYWRVVMVTIGPTQSSSKRLVDGELLVPTVWVTEIKDGEVPDYLKESAGDVTPPPQEGPPPHS